MRRSNRFLAAAAATLSLSLVPALARADGEPTLLERLSAETAAVAAKGEAAAATLVSDDRRYGGALVGDPARLVVAIDGDALAPREGKVETNGPAGITSTTATLLDADADVGLAIYALAEPRKGLRLSGAEALARGALLVAGGGGRVSLVAMPGAAGDLEDLNVDVSLECHLLLSASGTLAGLRPAQRGVGAWWARPAAAADALRLRAVLALSKAGRFDVKIEPTPQTSTMPLVAYLSAANGLTYNTKGYALYGMQGVGQTGFVPGPVIARALEDVSRPGAARLRRAYLGVVTQDAPRAPKDAAWDSTAAVPSPRLATRVVSSPGGETVTYASSDGGATWSPGAQAVALTTVLPNSPAARAGLEKGMVILEVDGTPVLGSGGFARALARRRPGETVTLAIRDRAEPVRVVLSDRDEDGKGLATAGSVGLSVQSTTPDLIAFLNLGKDVQGVVVRSVDEGSAAAAAGLRRGDVILEGGGGPIRDPGELEAVLGAASEGVLLDVLRGSERMAVHLALPKSDGKGRAR